MKRKEFIKVYSLVSISKDIKIRKVFYSKKEVFTMPIAKCLMCHKHTFKYKYTGKCTSCGAGVMTKAQAKTKKTKKKRV